MGNEVLIKVENVSKKFCRRLKRSLWYGVKDIAGELFFRDPSKSDLRPEEFWALKDITFELRRGECLGLIGRNGAGKTTLLKLINGLIKPDKGKITVFGKVGALIELGTGFNPVLTGRENIYINASILGISKKVIDQKIDDIIDFAEIREFINTPVQSYSSGMKVRLGFAIATAMEPDVLLLDEVLAVGDVGFRAKCFHRIGKLLKDTAVIFVSHNMVQVSRLCDRSVFLEKGHAGFLGETDMAIEKYFSSISTLKKDYSKTVHDVNIKEFRCNVLNDQIEYGQNLEIELIFNSKEGFECGNCLIAIGRSEFFYGQTDFSNLLKRIPKGKSKFILHLGPILLSKNEYYISVTIMDKSNKNTVIHSINCVKFEVKGSRGYGVAYQIPVIKGVST